MSTTHLRELVADAWHHGNSDYAPKEDSKQLLGSITESPSSTHDCAVFHILQSVK